MNPPLPAHSMNLHDADLFLNSLNKEKCNDMSPEWGSQGATPDSGIGRSIEWLAC